MKKMKKNIFIFLAIAWGIIFFAPSVYAIENMNIDQQSFAYDLYDIAVNKVLKGPIGFVSGAAAIVLGAVSAITGRIMGAIPAVLGGAALLNADKIVDSLGLLF